jgi:predicted transcriptional regulator of viral defense system
MALRREKTTELLRLARGGPLRARDLAAAGIPRAYLTRLSERGQLEHVGRGIYRLPDAPVTELHAVAQVAKRVPHATVCLLSALQIHGLTTEVPHAVWIMIDTRARRPKIDTPAIEIVEAHGPARAHGVETRKIEGVLVSVTAPAKTVADCFRYRRHVGLEVAIAALREYLQRREPGGSRRENRIDALVAAARADRVYSVMRPYLEALA